MTKLTIHTPNISFAEFEQRRWNLATQHRIPVPNEEYLRVQDVMKLTGLTERNTYRKMRKGTFPRSIRVSYHFSVWSRNEIMQWLERRNTTV